MWIAAAEFDILLGDVRSLKQKRALVRPLIAEIRRFEVSVAEVGHHDLHRRALVGAAAVSSSAAHAGEVLDRIEAVVAEHPEFELLSVHRTLHSSFDE
ncbi:DUF503 domain-containing protein [Salinibacterium sp. SYSU T00001]|uniref:DUF503 domain-containing protein n=1 Tax=Homoserinimonas sedimenticola TaxID=2986805 RepID=UPI00223653B6|nr:DUF503 domain-containing protein [Salinibacterium sedimenticola]MCW4384796.1 DUF503 domain-containing protein [Salinibacterium sedimenticola]